MLSTQDQNRILRLTKDFWQAQVEEREFREIFQGKEIGHRIADFVDERTTKLLIDHMPGGYQLDKKGRRQERSMGDVWLRSNEMYNPVNIKAGEFGKDGQPNLVSINKLLEALFKSLIDSYYLLIIKMLQTPKVSTSSGADETTISTHIYLVDVLDHLDVVTFDSGPGQLMLKEKLFYEKMARNTDQQTKNVSTKIMDLLWLKEDGDRRLFYNRKQKLPKLKKKAMDFAKQSNQIIDQRNLNIG